MLRDKIDLSLLGIIRIIKFLIIFIFVFFILLFFYEFRYYIFYSNIETYFGGPYKKYINKVLGFEIKYPDVFTISENTEQSAVVFQAPEGPDYFKKKTSILDLITLNWDSPLRIDICVVDSIEHHIMQVDTVEINGITAILYYQWGSGSHASSSYIYVYYLTPSRIFLLHANEIWGEFDPYSKNEEEFKKCLLPIIYSFKKL